MALKADHLMIHLYNFMPFVYYVTFVTNVIMVKTKIKWLEARPLSCCCCGWLSRLSATIYFSIRYQLLCQRTQLCRVVELQFFYTDPAFWPAIFNSLILVGSVLIICIGLGIAIAVLINLFLVGVLCG